MDKNRSRGEISVLEILGVLVIILVLAALLLPMFARNGHGTYASTCQSNINQIGKALRSYVTDWDDKFPINLDIKGQPAISVKPVDLDVPGNVDANGNVKRFQNGINWVEGLYSYIEPISHGSANPWKCPKALKLNASTSAQVTYAFNSNLIGEDERIIKYPPNQMLLREMDRCVDAELRPTNKSRWTSKIIPQDAFLTNNDSRLGKTESNLHGRGSHILFADSHVHLVMTLHMPRNLSNKQSWDPTTRQWYNFYYANPTTPEQRRVNKSIAITP